MNINGKNIPFSFSQNRLYGDCPRKYKFRYVDNIVEPTNDNLELGSAIHKLFECLEHIIRDYTYNYTQPIREFVESYIDSSAAKEYSDAMKTILTLKTQDYLDRLTSAWLEWHKDKKIIACENRLEFDDFVAIIDVTYQRPDGTYVLGDYKVTKKPKTISSVYSEGQLLLYKYMYNQVYNIPPEMIEVEYVNVYSSVTPKLITTVNDNPDIQECLSLWKSTKITKQKILNGEFPKNRKWCNWCYYKDMCASEK